ncbi:MAG: biopolymer transporter ExbD [Planctomycetota bacterium]|nr:biopolymer transporter ExbD [Planctomycetota bacterium]
MIRVRRPTWDARIELAPLLDIVLLLLMFFIYACLLMVRVDLMPMELRTFQSGVGAKPVPAATIAIDLAGVVYLDRTKIKEVDLVKAIQARLQIEPLTVVYLAIADGEGTVDRTSLMLDVWEHLQMAGIDVNLIGKPPKSAP